MKKLILIILALWSFTAYGQSYSSPGRPAGVDSKTPTFGIKTVSPDSLSQLWLSIGGNRWFRLMTGMDVIVFDAKVFQGLGTTSSKLTFRDTLLKSNWVINPADTLHPVLTLIQKKSQDNLWLKGTGITDGRATIRFTTEKDTGDYEYGFLAGGDNNLYGLRNVRAATPPNISWVWSVNAHNSDYTNFYRHVGMTGLTDTSTAAKILAIDANGKLFKVAYSGGGGGTTTHPLTMNNTGGGAASGSIFDGSVAQTISYNTVGALSDGSTVAGHSFISDNVTLSSLSATNPSITFTGSYTGQVNRTLGINWGFSNPWTIVQQFQGGISYNSRSASSTDAILQTDYYLNYTGTFTATLPQSSLIVPNQTYVVTSNTGTVTLAAFSGETISGGASITIAAGQTATVYYAGSLNWAVAQIATISGASVVTSFNTRTGAVVPVAGDYASLTETLTNKTISGASNTLTNIDNSSLVNSTVSGVALGNSLFAHTPGFGLSGSNYDGHNAQTWTVDTATAVKGKTGYNTDYSNLSTRINSKVPTTRTLTINGVAFDLSADRSWTVGSSVTPVSGEIPTGTINGTNPTFTIAHTPISGSVSVYINGIMARPTTDWTMSGTTVTMIDIPVTGDNLMISYQY